jgi:hypothetical protein
VSPHEDRKEKSSVVLFRGKLPIIGNRPITRLFALVARVAERSHNFCLNDIGHFRFQYTVSRCAEV